MTDPVQEPAAGQAPNPEPKAKRPVKKKKADSETIRVEKKATPAKARILIVEDIAMVRTTLRKILESGGYAVTEASSAHGATALLTRDKPDLILVDIMMPVVNGIQFCREIKEDAATRDIPVAMCTAMNQKPSIIEAVQAGACEYILKPFSRDTVLTKVEKILAQVRSAAPSAVEKPPESV